MYQYEDRVSYSEVDENLNLTYENLVNYMQDCSCFHSDEVGYGVEYLSPKHMGWFVTNYEIHIIRMPKYSERIRISTYPYQFRGMMGRRIYKIETLDGQLLAYADSLWILMNLDTGKPARIPEAFYEAYLTGDDKPQLELSGDRVRYDGEGKLVGKFTVDETRIDTNSHMNNSQYIDVTRRFLPNGIFGTIVINYKKAAQLHDELEVYLKENEGSCQVVLMKNNEVYTVVEYR